MSAVPLHLAFSAGGSTVRGARVLPSGALDEVRVARRGDRDDPFLTAAGLADWISRSASEIAKGRPVDLFGLAIKGPGTLREGKLVIGRWSDTPFREQALPFQEMLENALPAHGVRYTRFRAMQDSESALRGEAHARGGLAGIPSGMIKIWGTGRSVKAREKGKLVVEVRPDAAGSDRWRVHSSDGRHLIWIPDGRGSFRYEYRGVPQGLTRAPIDEQAGEVYYSERTGGQWLPKIVANDLLCLSAGERARVLRAMGAEDLDPGSYVVSGSRGDAEVDAEKRILAGLTAAARGGDGWSRARLAAIGAEEGAAIAAFVWEFQEYGFVENIILVSTIGELLGKDVRGDNGEDDLLVGALRRSLLAALTRRGVGQEKARLVAAGVRRSALGWERELLAFDPDATLE
jgi:hypothetical protein